MADDARALLAEALYNDPVVGQEFKELIAKKFPQAPIPEIAAKKAVEPALEPLKKELADLKEERKKERQHAALRAGRQAIMQDPVLAITEAEMPEVEKLMISGEAGSHMTAAQAYRYRQRLTESAAPSAYDFSGMKVPGHNGAGGDEYQADTKTGRPGIMQDRRGWTRHRINEVLNEQARQQPMAASWR